MRKPKISLSLDENIMAEWEEYATLQRFRSVQEMIVHAVNGHIRRNMAIKRKRKHKAFEG